MSELVHNFKLKLKVKNKPKGTYGAIYKGNYIPYGYFAKYGNNEAVYGIKSKTSSKIYIGTTKHLQLRLNKHFNELFHNKHRNKKLQEDFNIYSFNDFEIIIYSDKRSLDIEKEKQKEIGIENLYNEKISGYYVTEEYKKQLSNTSKETHKTTEYRNKMRKLKTNKIAQYDFSFNLIKIWNSAIEICETLGYTRSVILSCCNGNKKSAYSYLWRYIDDNGNIVTDGYAKARKNKN